MGDLFHIVACVVMGAALSAALWMRAWAALLVGATAMGAMLDGLVLERMVGPISWVAIVVVSIVAAWWVDRVGGRAGPWSSAAVGGYALNLAMALLMVKPTHGASSHAVPHAHGPGFAAWAAAAVVAGAVGGVVALLLRRRGARPMACAELGCMSASVALMVVAAAA